MFSAWAMHDGPGNHTLRLSAVMQGAGTCTPADPSYVPIAVQNDVPPNTWVYLSGTGAVGGTGCTMARLYLEQGDTPDGGTLPTLFIDDAYATR